MPMGNPEDEKPQQTLMAGSPVTLKGKVDEAGSPWDEISNARINLTNCEVMI
jgi:hypothetical protein